MHRAAPDTVTGAHPSTTARHMGEYRRCDYAGSEPSPSAGKTSRAGWLYGGMNATMTEPLTVADRCDRCGAQAYVRVVLPSGELLFCAHHAREHAPKFAEMATLVQDETDRLAAEHGSRTSSTS